MKNQSPLLWAVTLYLLSTLVSMAVMNIAAALLVVVLIRVVSTYGIIEQIRKFLKNKLIRQFAFSHIALFGICILSLLVAKLHPWSFGGRSIHVDILSDGAKSWYVLWPWVTAVAIGLLNKEDRNRALTVYLVFAGVLGALGIVQFFTGFPRPQPIPETNHFHATLFLGHHLSVASVLPFAFFLCLDRTISLRRFAWGVAAVLIAITLFLTYSRALWIGLPIAVVIYFLSKLSKKAAVITGLLIAVAGVLLFQDPEIRYRALDHNSVHSRSYLWDAHLNSFRENPMLGVGWNKTIEAAGLYVQDKLGSDVFVSHAHNNVLEMLAGTGILGALAWLIWWVFVFRMGFRVKWKWLICAFVVFHINGMLQVNFWESKVLHQVLLWVAFLIVENYEEAQSFS